MDDINSVVITGNLTRDPELKNLDGGGSVANLRIAVNGSRKDPQSGEWVGKPNFFDVVVWGNSAVACSEHLVKGSALAVRGRLDWRQWEAKDGSGKRQAVKIVAERTRFLGSPSSAAARSDDGEGGGGTSGFEQEPEFDEYSGEPMPV